MRRTHHSSKKNFWPQRFIRQTMKDFDLNRFLGGQQFGYDWALKEIQAGKKELVCVPSTEGTGA